MQLSYTLLHTVLYVQAKKIQSNKKGDKKQAQKVPPPAKGVETLIPEDNKVRYLGVCSCDDQEAWCLFMFFAV